MSSAQTPPVISPTSVNHKVRKKSWTTRATKSAPAVTNGNAGNHHKEPVADVPLSLDAHPTIHSQALKIVVLGSACSGKTSIIRQFTGNGQNFADQYDPTDTKSSHFKTVLTFDTNNQRVTHWQLKIVDIPVTEVPISAMVSWSNFLQFDIGNAAAYLLVFDVSAQFHSFDFVRTVREQLINHRSTASSLIFVVANKTDLPYQLNRCDLVHITQKQWKLPFLECSAKRNYHVHELFETIIEAVQNKQSAVKAQQSEGIRRTFKSSKCVIQ